MIYSVYSITFTHQSHVSSVIKKENFKFSTQETL